MAAFTLTIDVTDSPEAQDSIAALITSFATEAELYALPGIRVINLAVGNQLPSPFAPETPDHGNSDQHTDS